MNAPDLIHAWPSQDGWGHAFASKRLTGPHTSAEYLRRDSAVLAADPMVQALVAAVIEEAAKALFDWLGSKDDALMEARIEATIADFAEDSRQMDTMICNVIRALRPDAAASLARMLRDARNEGLERAAVVADGYGPCACDPDMRAAIRNLKEPTDDQA